MCALIAPSSSDNSSVPPCYTWKLGSSTFRAMPECGARLLDWNLTLAGQRQRSVIQWPDNADWDNLAGVRGGNPILFPFASRSYHRGLEYHWADPDGKKRPMPSHGFAREGRFNIEAIDEEGFTARLQPTAEDAEAYPFRYAFRVRYRFEELALKVELLLRNEDERPIPWSAGHHFYFTLPWIEGSRRKDYELHMQAKKAVYFSPEGKLIGEKLQPGPINFGDPAIVDRIHFQLRHRQIEFGPLGGEERVFIRIGDGEPPAANNTVVTWTESEDSPFYCVEPWMGLPNAAEHGKGLHWVDPGQEGRFVTEVSLY